MELTFYSAYLKGEAPVSALITAPPEAGKTETVMAFADNEGIVILNDCTAFGIMRDYGDAIREKKVRHLVIPDLVRPLARGKDTVHSLVAFLNSLIEEGVLRISTYAENIGVKPTEEGEAAMPVKCGLVATLAREILEDGRHHWKNMGFMSRLVPISYQYAVPTALSIHQSIAKREYLEQKPIKLNIPKEDATICLEEPQAGKLMELTTYIGNKEGLQETYGFRLQKHIQRLAMASALKEGREKVEDVDIEKLTAVSGCINLEYYPI